MVEPHLTDDLTRPGAVRAGNLVERPRLELDPGQHVPSSWQNKRSRELVWGAGMQEFVWKMRSLIDSEKDLFFVLDVYQE
ncbi:hypothetical protein [Thalassobaculum fulvum]|uniref:hypothetical protein n=1 Tax=Thalassobaculum fulvum TaxID=1633335 RepID=UPI0016719620|nr:hypothetical protein [Thalassobaculum fulvum]